VLFTKNRTYSNFKNYIDFRLTEVLHNLSFRWLTIWKFPSRRRRWCYVQPLQPRRSLQADQNSLWQIDRGWLHTSNDGWWPYNILSYLASYACKYL